MMKKPGLTVEKKRIIVSQKQAMMQKKLRAVQATEKEAYNDAMKKAKEVRE